MFGWCLAEGKVTEISAHVRKAVAHRRRVCNDARYAIHANFTLFSILYIFTALLVERTLTRTVTNRPLIRYDTIVTYNVY